MTPAGKKKLLDAVAGGKGFVGFHSASDTFHSKGPRNENQTELDPYIAMLGGEFIVHGSQQKATMKVASPKFPGLDGVEDFAILEEWYALKNFAKDLHVILVQETKGMDRDDACYHRPPFPATWARNARQGPRLLHLAGPPRGRVDQSHLREDHLGRFPVGARGGRGRHHAQHRQGHAPLRPVEELRERGEGLGIRGQGLGIRVSV